MKEKWNYFKREISYFLEQCSFPLRVIDHQKLKENLTNIIESYEKESREYER